MEAVKQGSICVGLRSKDFVVCFQVMKKNKDFQVLCTLKKSKSELASHQEKVFKVDDHIGMAISGLTADASILRINAIL